MMYWLSHINGAGWAAILTPTIMVLLMVFSKKPVKPDEEGWYTLRPSIALRFFGALFFLVAVPFTIMPILAFGEKSIFILFIFLVIGPVMAMLMWYGVYAVFVVVVRFNDQGIEYKGLLKKLFVRWADVQKITDSVWLGTYASTNNGRLVIWKLLRGFQQLVDAARERGIEIDPALSTDR